MELYFKVLGLWLVIILSNMATSAGKLVCGNKETQCGTNSFCDGSTCRSCKLIADYCFKDMMPPECMDFCRAHLRNQEEIKCENKLKNLTETLEKANTVTTFIPDMLNKTTDIQLESSCNIWFIIATCVVCTTIFSILILYILHLRRRIAYLNRNNIQDGESIRMLSTNNNDDNNNDNDRDALGTNIADGVNPANGVQDNEPHSPEHGILLDALRNNN